MTAMTDATNSPSRSHRRDGTHLEVASFFSGARAPELLQEASAEILVGDKRYAKRSDAGRYYG
jgi:hypothetical protein